MSPGVSRFAFLTIQGEFPSWEHWVISPFIPLFFPPFRGPPLKFYSFPILLLYPFFHYTLLHHTPHPFILSHILFHFSASLLFFTTPLLHSSSPYFIPPHFFIPLLSMPLFHITPPLYSPTLSFIPPISCLLPLAPFIPLHPSIPCHHFLSTHHQLSFIPHHPHLDGACQLALLIQLASIPPHHFYSTLPPLFHLTLFIQFLSTPLSHVTPCSPLCHITPYIPPPPFIPHHSPLFNFSPSHYPISPSPLLITHSSHPTPICPLIPFIIPHPLYSIFLHPLIPYYPFPFISDFIPLYHVTPPPYFTSPSFVLPHLAFPFSSSQSFPTHQQNFTKRQKTNQ